MRNIIFIGLLIFSVNLWSAESRDSGFYIGGGVGFSGINDNGMGDNQSFDNNSIVSRVFGGYQFNPYVAAEASVDSLGIYNGETMTSSIDSNYSAITFSLVGRMPLGGGFSVFAQGGAGAVSLYQNVDGIMGPFFIENKEYTSSDFSTVAGAGLSYLIPNYNSVEIRLGYFQTNFSVDAISVNTAGKLFENSYDQKIKQFYLGAAYHF